MQFLLSYSHEDSWQFVYMQVSDFFLEVGQICRLAEPTAYSQEELQKR